ncbi:MAG: hypothetical protein PHT88_00905 [Candidatus Moranbacteria bacterium]|nr:hypothetical protein [Candidatus Moranbacteria bacterium]
MWNPFTKKDEDEKKDGGSQAAVGPDMKNMNMLQRMAMKRFMAMSPQEQQKMVQKMMTPKNIAKHKDEILQQLEEARKSGMVSDDQYRLAKRKMGLDK